MQLHNLLTSKGDSQTKTIFGKSSSTEDAARKMNKKSQSKPLPIDRSDNLVKEIQAMIIS